jgi:hypothetical protein
LFHEGERVSAVVPETVKRREPLREAPMAGVRAVGAPVAGVADRRRARLPERPGWDELKRAIVWAELIGPPRALAE